MQLSIRTTTLPALQPRINQQPTTDHFISTIDLVSASQVLYAVQLLNSGLISEDDFLFAIGFDIPKN